jgi:hypothetical protein
LTTIIQSGKIKVWSIKRKELLELVANREKTTVGEIIAEIYRLRRAPKRSKT